MNNEQQEQLLQELRARDGYDTFFEKCWQQHQELGLTLQQQEPNNHRPPSNAKRLWQQWNWWLGTLTGTCAIAALFIMLVPRTQQTTPTTQRKSSTPPILTSKGTPLRLLYSRDGVKSQWMKPKQALRPGTLVQFVYTIGNDSHVMLLVSSTKNNIKPLLDANNQSIAKHAGEHSFPEKGSLELDHSLEKETIFLVISNKSFSFEEARQAITNAAPHQQKEKRQWHIYSLVLYKEQP